jgi:multidrug efflux pump
MNLSKFFIDRPIFAGVLSLLMLIAGLIALRGLPISEYPEVAPPSVVVRAQYPGANPKVIAETVATPLEEQINGVEGMLYMGSQATTDGVLTLTVTFRLGTDPDKAQQLVQNRVSQAEPRLPEEVRRLGITTVKSAPDLTMVVHLVSPNNRYDINYLRNYAVLNVKDPLARIEGVGQVQIFGGGDYSMRVWLDPQKVAQRGLSASDVVAAIRGQNVQAAAGVVGASPGLSGVDMQLSINAQGRLQSEEEFGDIIVKSGTDGAVTRLRDIGRLEMGAADYSLRSLLNNDPAVGMGVFQAPGLQRARHLGQRSQDDDRAQQEHARRPGIPHCVRPDAVRARVHRIGDPHAARSHHAGGARRDPVPADLARLDHSAAGRAGVGDRYLRGAAHPRFLDQCAESLRAGAGHRHRGGRRHRGGGERRAEHRGRGSTPRQATYRAMREVSGPIIAIALVLVAVFVPLAFISGLTGQFYRQFAVTIAISTVISAINSLTLSPALAALLLRGHDQPKDALTRGMDKAFGWLFRGFNKLFHRSARRPTAAA